MITTTMKIALAFFGLILGLGIRLMSKTRSSCRELDTEASETKSRRYRLEIKGKPDRKLEYFNFPEFPIYIKPRIVVQLKYGESF